MSIILGLDIGVNSIGWSLFDSEQNSYLQSGVRIQSDVIDPLGKEEEQNPNIDRRSKRQRRRLISRKLYRKLLLFKKLNELKFIEYNSIEDFRNDIQQLNPYKLRYEALYRKLSLLEISRIFYQFAGRRGFLSNRKQISKSDNDERSIVKKSIEEIRQVLNNRTLGQFLYELYPTDGAPFEYRDRIRKRYTGREMYIEEFNKIWEFQSQFYPDLLNETNKKIIGDSKTGVLFYQRPLKSQKGIVGRCTFEPNKKRASKSRYEFEEYSFYQMLNNITLTDINTGEILKPDSELRQKILELALNQKSRLTIKQIKSKLKLKHLNFNYEDNAEFPEIKFMQFVHHLFPKSYIKKYFGDVNFYNKVNDLWELLNYGTDDEWIINTMKSKKHFPEDNQCGFTYNQERLNLIKDYYHKAGYASLSLKAIRNILPFLKEGYIYNVAVILGGIKNAFGNQYDNLSSEEISKIKQFVENLTAQKHSKKELSSKLEQWLKENFNLSKIQLQKLYHHTLENIAVEIFDRLPLYKGNLRNPKVMRALFEVRKIINALLDKYGNIDKIVIEIATELRKNKEELRKLIKQQKDNKKANEDAKKFLESRGIEPTRDSIEKYRLWYEMVNRNGKNAQINAQAMCPYTGKVITLDNLFNGNAFDVEHIIPFSRSMNNSLENKTLCDADFNRNIKKNYTPFEVFTLTNIEDWNEVKKRAYKLLPISKYRRFISETVKEENEFASNKLNDTRYIAKAVAEYVKSIGVDVRVVSGSITGIMRRLWGLNKILNDLNKELFLLENIELDVEEKNRLDHRHHALDAMVLCQADYKIIHNISNIYSKNKSIEKLNYPYKGFIDDIREQLENILISIKQKDRIVTNSIAYVKVNGKVKRIKTFSPRGPLHEETFYGRHIHPIEKTFIFTHRIPIENITKMSQVEKIVDINIRKIIEDYLNKYNLLEPNGKDIKKGAFFETSEDKKIIYKLFLPNRNGQPVPIKKIRVYEESQSLRPIPKEKNKWVAPGANHHADIYQTKDGKYYQELVTFWDVVERVKNKQPVYGNPMNTDRYIMSIKRNDLFILNAPENIDLTDCRLIAKYLYRVQKISFLNKLSVPYYNFRKINATTTKLSSQEIRITNFITLKNLNPVRLKLNSIGDIIDVLRIEF